MNITIVLITSYLEYVLQLFRLQLYLNMEKSLINEFKNSSSTLFHSTVLGTNSLLAQRSPREHEMFKSRIAHLPSDHREDLAKKIDFVVVFQAIEIERLSQQISFLRGRLRQYDGRTHNASSYEIQIRQLMEKCNKLENEKYSYRQELSQTKDASENIFNELSILKSRYADVDFCVAEKYKLEKARNEELCLEIEKWKSRYSSLQKIKGEELDGYKRLYQSQKSSLVSRESKDILAKFEIQKEELLGKLRDRKEQLDQRELEIKKLQNCFEQLQVRSKEDNAKIESYEEKVALLSQETFRLNEMMRAKQEEIKSMKLMHEDFSLRMSRFTSLDQTKNQLNDRVRVLQDENDDLRQENRAMSQNLSHLKRKISEIERLQFQIKEAKADSDSKLKAMERKDRRIIVLEEEAKQMKGLEGEIKRLYEENARLKQDLADLQERLDAKIEQLRRIKQQQIAFLRWRDDFNAKMQVKLNQYEQVQQQLQAQFSQQRHNAQQILKDSSNYELRIKEVNIQLKEKDYKISSLQNELKQIETKDRIKQAERKETIQELEQHLFAQRRSFQQKMKDLQVKGRESERYVKQAQQKSREADARYREIQAKFRDYQTANNVHEMKARNLQAECNDLQAWGRSLQSNNRQLQLHIRQLQIHLSQVGEENMQLKHIIEQQHEFYRSAEQRYFEIGQQLKSLKYRLENIQKILISLKTNITLKLKSAQESDNKIHRIQDKYNELFQWFISLANQMQKDGDRYRDSPIKKPYSHLPSDSSFRFSPIREDPSFPSSPLHRARSSQRTRQNINLDNRNQQIPSQFLLRHVLLCIEVQSLRKRIGDKNAKVQSLRSSIVSKGIQPSGFFSSRDTSHGKKPNIYY